MVQSFSFPNSFIFFKPSFGFKQLVNTVVACVTRAPISFFSAFESHVAISMLSRQRDTSRFKYLFCNSTLRHVSLLRNGWLKKIYTIKLDAVIVTQREKLRY